MSNAPWASSTSIAACTARMSACRSVSSAMTRALRSAYDCCTPAAAPCTGDAHAQTSAAAGVQPWKMIHQKMIDFQDFTTHSIFAFTSRRSGTVQNRPVPALDDPYLLSISPFLHI